MPAVPLERALREAAVRDPHRPAITDGERTLTRREVVEMVDRAATRLAQTGTRPSDLVAVSGENSAELIATFFAIWRLGAVPVPLHPRKARAELVALVRGSGARVAVGFPDDHASAWPGVVALGLAGLFRPGAIEPLPQAPTSPRLRVGTSGGSTGPSKLISVDVPAITNPARPWHHGMQPDGTHVVPLALCDGSGFVAATSALALGCHQILMREPDPVELLRLVARHRVDWLAATHPVLLGLAKLPREVRDAHDVSSLRWVTQYSGAIPAWATHRLIDWLGAGRIAESYGATDARGSTWITGEQWLERPGSVGRAAAGCEIAAFGADGARLPPGEVGAIHIRDLTGRRNYHYLGAEAAAATDGWESVGDLGRLDDDGFVYLLDRDKDMIRTAQGSVAPLSVEGALERHPDVRSAVVVGLPDGAAERVHAIVDTAGREVAPADLERLLDEEFAEVRRPDSWEFCDEPLRDLAGKAQRLRLRAARSPSST
jgi:bile acid-coenzyme A ligase